MNGAFNEKTVFDYAELANNTSNRLAFDLLQIRSACDGVSLENFEFGPKLRSRYTIEKGISNADQNVEYITEAQKLCGRADGGQTCDRARRCRGSSWKEIRKRRL